MNRLIDYTNNLEPDAIVSLREVLSMLDMGDDTFTEVTAYLFQLDNDDYLDSNFFLTDDADLKMTLSGLMFISSLLDVNAHFAVMSSMAINVISEDDEESVLVDTEFTQQMLIPSGICKADGSIKKKYFTPFYFKFEDNGLNLTKEGLELVRKKL